MAKLPLPAFLAVAMIVSMAVHSGQAEEIKCEGTITAIDGDMLTVKDTTAEHQMRIDPATKIMLNGKPISAMDLKVGQKVKCMCERKGKEITCTTLVVMKEMEQR